MADFLAKLAACLITLLLDFSQELGLGSGMIERPVDSLCDLIGIFQHKIMICNRIYHLLALLTAVHLDKFVCSPHNDMLETRLCFANGCSTTTESGIIFQVVLQVSLGSHVDVLRA